MIGKIMVAVVMAWFLATVPVGAQTRQPDTSLKEALAKAETYVRDNKIDVSELFLLMIYRSEFHKNPKQNNWTVIWAPKNPRILDGELRVYIYDDGRIEHGGSA